jgi:hypothetical protein
MIEDYQKFINGPSPFAFNWKQSIKRPGFRESNQKKNQIAIFLKE